MRKIIFYLGLLGLLIICSIAGADVVINEISYNPPDEQYTTGSIREFIELYNPGPDSVDVSGYYFDKGTTFVLPEGSLMAPYTYLVLARDPDNRIWNNAPSPVIGPLEGKLSNSGERLSLVRPDGTVVEELKYNDSPPWSRSADGYGSTLERIAWDLPADDFHSWRASLLDEGTPGLANSISGTKPRPVILAHEVLPEHPTSSDEVAIRMGFDAANIIKSVTLQWEKAEQGVEGGSNQGPETYVSSRDNFQYWKGNKAPSESDLWAAPDFDDSSWRRGQGTFGYGGSGWNRNRTELNDMRRNYSTVYLRRKFSIPDADTLANVNIMVRYTGGFVCYLNGIEVASDNIPQSVNHESLATDTHSSNNWEIFTIPNDNGLLQNENNTLAMVGLNSSLTASSFSLGVSLVEGEHIVTEVESDIHQILMTRIAESVDSVTYEAKIPAMPSQSLIRFNAKLILNDDSTLVLPHVMNLRPFESYFVYDGEVESLLTILWPYYESPVSLIEMERIMSGAVILPAGETHPLVFDGAMIHTSRNGQKMKFLKGEEYRGDRTLNMLPEYNQTGNTSGPSTPHREDLGFWFFREMGIPAPLTDWFRVIVDGSHTQRIMIQQVNERFLEINDRNPDADLFKRNYVSPNWEPHNNLENGTASIDNLETLLKERDKTKLHELLETNLDVDEFIQYITACVLLSNWDGFHNNHWMTLDPDTQKWEMIPWDLDKAWGYTDSNPMFTEMPLEFPLNGRAAHAGRDTGPITGPLCKDEVFYQQYIDRMGYEFNHAFTEERMFGKFAEVEKFLLDDLQLLEEHTGAMRNTRREQITDSYDILRTFVQLRREFLSTLLPTPVSNWSLY